MRFLLKIFFILTIFISHSSSEELDPSTFDDLYNSISNAYYDGQLSDAEAYENYLYLADRGHIDSSIEVGWFLYTGIETSPGSNSYLVPSDYQLALEYLDEPINLKKINALAIAGYIHEEGPGEYGWQNVPQNLPEAVRLYTMATELGHLHAPFQLAMIYASGGEGVEKNINEAISLMKKLAESGYEGAEDQLASLEKQVSNDNPTYKLKEAMETYILIETCHEMNAVFYVTEAQMQDFKKKMGDLDDYYVSLGADSDNAWSQANEKPSKTNKQYMDLFEIYKLAGSYDAEIEQYCNLVKFSFPEGDPNKKESREKNF
tara:strand:- start:200 stop:1153 length:954 start_codon:yes stop_codon:yes gene_type:complete